MLGVNVVAADTDAEARRLFTSLQQAFVNLRRGRPTSSRRRSTTSSAAHADGSAQLDPMLVTRRCRRAGRGARGLEAFVERTGADELIVASQIYDHAARLRSYEITAAVRDEIAGE